MRPTNENLEKGLQKGEEVRINTLSLLEIEDYLTTASSLFVPPLDTYVDIPQYSKKIKENATTIELWREDVLMGLAAVYFNDENTKRGFLTHINISKEYLGRGFGSILMKEILEYGKKIEFKEISLEVKKNNTKAIKIYEKFGFEKYDEKEDSVYMIYYLENEK
jgi:ribosomal protein S18 acetylase RimI-like enzyme